MNPFDPSRHGRRFTLWLLALLTAGSLVTATAADLRAQGSPDDDETVATEKVVKKATPRFVETLLDKLELDYQPSGKTGTSSSSKTSRCSCSSRTAAA